MGCILALQISRDVSSTLVSGRGYAQKLQSVVSEALWPFGGFSDDLRLESEEGNLEVPLQSAAMILDRPLRVVRNQQVGLNDGSHRPPLIIRAAKDGASPLRGGGR
jgi:hypothetical protein